MKKALFATLLLLGCGRSGLLLFSPQVEVGQVPDAGKPPVVDVVEDRSCPADHFKAIGTPCPTNGVSCGTCSPSACDWCNILSCQDHRWQNLEAFPAPPEVCDFGCGAGTCDRFKEVCVEHLGRDTACAVQFTCEALPKPCVNCEALDGGGNLLQQGCAP
jgi:hypothetical protein